MEESTRQNLVMAFSNVLRTSSLVGVIDVQRASLAFGAMLEQDDLVELDLQALHDFLIEQGGPPPAVIEVSVFLKSREARFGMQMVLPPDLQALTDEEREAIVTTFTTRGATSGTRAGRAPGAVTGTHPRSQSGPFVVPGSVTMPSTSRSGTFKPPEPEYAPGRQAPSSKRLLPIVAVVVVLLGVVNVVYHLALRAPGPTPVVLNDPAGLPCEKAIGANDVVICHVATAWFTANAPAAVDARAAITKANVVSKGYKKLLVMTTEDLKVRRAY